jgi:hypothetical protein
MAVIDLRQDLASTFANLGKGVGDILNKTVLKDEKEKAETRRALREAALTNPAQTAKALRRPGMDAESFRKLGINDEQLIQIMQLNPESFEEALENARLKTQNPQLRAETENLDLQATGAEALARVPEADVRRRTANAVLELGLPEAEPLARLAEVAYKSAKSTQDLEVLDEYTRYVKGLPQAEREAATLAMANPTFLQDVRRREENVVANNQWEREFGLRVEGQRLQRAIAEASAAQSQADATLKLFDVKREFLAEFRNIEEAMVKDGANLEVLGNRFNMLSDDYTKLFPADPVTIVNFAEKFWGKEVGDVKFESFVGAEGRTNLMAAALAAGKINADDLMEAVRQGLTKEELGKINERAADLQGRAGRGSFENFIDSVGRGLNSMNGQTGNFIGVQPVPTLPMRSR